MGWNQSIVHRKLISEWDHMLSKIYLSKNKEERRKIFSEGVIKELIISLSKSYKDFLLKLYDRLRKTS